MTTSLPTLPDMTPQTSPLTFLSDVSTADMTQVVLIESGIHPQFQSYVNSTSFGIVYEPDSSIADLVTLLRQKFTSIQRIAVVSHFNVQPKFLENESLFSSTDLVPGVTSFSKNTQGLIDILKEFNVAHVDFLACKTLTDPNWTAFFSVLQAQANGVVVGASLDDTGNLKYGGNWDMENTQENVKQVYFNNSIDNYASLLAVVAITYSFGVLNYSYTVGDNTAAITSTGTLTGAVILPEFVEISGVNYNVVSFAAFDKTLCANVTSIVILSKIVSTPTRAFSYLRKLESVSFPSTLATFGPYCFEECWLLSSFNWPPLVTSIPTYFFAMSLYTTFNMRYISPLVIPNSITSIGSHAFVFLGAVPSVYIPPNCTLSIFSFYQLAAVTDITCYGSGTLPLYAFGTNPSLVNLTFGPGITSIVSEAYIHSSKLTSLTLPSTLLSFDIGSLAYSPSMRQLTIPSSVTTITCGLEINVNSPLTMEITFSHTTSFPTVSLANRLPNNSRILVSNSVKQLSNYLTMLTRLTSDIAVTGMSSVNFSEFTPTIPTTTGATVQIAAISTRNMSDTTVIGTTLTEQKQFTSSTVKSLFTANSAQKQLILPAGSVLPGISASSDTPVYLFNASSAVANNKKTLLSKDDILSKTFYILLEAGDAITLQTNKGSVAVSKSGNTFTLTPSTGASVTKVSGETYSYDGLSITLGSVYGTLNPTNVNFVLTALNRQFQLSTASSIPSYSPTLVSDAVITLNTSVPADVMQNTFFYRTDRDITLDASFVYYYVDSSKWTNKSTVLNPKNGIVTTNMYVAQDAVGKDFLRDLAKQLFGTYLGADLFTNEDSVITDVNAKCDDVATYAVALINSIDKTAGTSTLMKTDLSGAKYLDDQISTSNISRELFNQLMTSAPARFNDTKLQKYNSDEDGFYKLPIFQGDTITFKMTISPSTAQTAAVPTGPTALLSRSYTVVMNVGDARR